MKIALRSLWLLSVVFAAGLALTPTPASAQAVAPTPEQAELLQSLPPEQRQILIEGARDSMTGTAPLTGVGQKVSPTQQAPGATEGMSVRERMLMLRDKDGDGIEDPSPAPKTPADLKPFGYDIFRRLDTEFEPEVAIPVPNDYVLGPGDRLEVQLYGNEIGNYVLVVGRDGQVRFPKLGPVSVGGMRFEDVRALIQDEVARQLVGTEVSVSMGELRSIRVFVLGDVQRPGSYLVSALSTMSGALLKAGGITPVGSLRDVQLRRNGATVVRLDLYDLLLKGSSGRDARLLAGDVVFVPPVGDTVSVFGEVKRPAIYEVRPGTTIGDVLNLAGGLRPGADPRYARLERFRQGSDRITVDVDLSSPNDRARRVENGDLLVVVAVRTILQGSVEVEGAVQRPRAFEFTPGMYLTDVLSNLDELTEDSDPEYVVVRREVSLGRIEVMSRDLRAALRAPRSAADLQLRARDRIVVLPRDSERAKKLEGLVTELKQQGQFDDPDRVVTVGGVVRMPGQYPLETGMRVSDLLRAGGRPLASAYSGTADLTRFDVANGQRREVAVEVVDLAAVLRGDPAANVLLQPFDVLTVKQLPEWSETEFVTLKGEVRFPGTYPIRRGETLRSVIERAGGILPGAFVEGAVFTRESLRKREREQLDLLAARLQNDLAVLALRNAQSPQKTSENDQALLVGRGLLTELQNAQPVGRLVLNLSTEGPENAGQVELRDGDELTIPRPSQSVTVLGEVQSPTSHLWREGLDRDDYINLSGGTTAKADSDRIYVVRADGSVVTVQSRFFGGSASQIRPGDTVVVPLDAERMRLLPMWTSVTQIIYNLAVAVLAITSI